MHAKLIHNCIDKDRHAHDARVIERKREREREREILNLLMFFDRFK